MQGMMQQGIAVDLIMGLANEFEVVPWGYTAPSINVRRSVQHSFW
ncbi:MAG: hypothetical protein IGNPGNKH_00770 [Sodalis sp. Ffu]|nr:MAG: hypothetical protein IGNPGNKH_00770 [Sodalis sp. Ffu]